ncbi:YIP1 family protein [Parasulfitobacter algicola]|uniref:YIP1 family protein n=1 Tax=Parasulfitobacter algicola TaxID=2614809 RepID=A0ABX2IYK8_9RHOB|nr:YIP1 family protein [Sulfitobacter algicola]NSX55343.1 YIP1 family protein [Sulfitobacter algicola]
MPVADNIIATYRGPTRVMQRLLDAGQREDRALAMVMGASALIFIAQWPKLARQAHLTEGVEIQQLIAGALWGIIFLLPLMLYGLAALSHMIARVFGGRGSWFGARLALFWSLLASTPLLMLHGLVAGFIGPGTQLSVVGVVWLVVFLVFWGLCLRVAELETPLKAD